MPDVEPPGSPLRRAAPKVYRFGTHRTADPEETVARVLRLKERMGLTRLSNITGLDVLGIPVCMACRPNSRSLAVFQGKGLSLAAAKASALMEAVEIFHAEHIDRPLRLARFGDFAAGTAIDPDALPRPRSAAGDPYGRLLWIEGRDLASDAPVWVPYELVSADYTVPLPPGGGAFAATTNGLGAGNHVLEAIAHGLYEAVERDAIALWRLGGSTLRAARRIDPASIEMPAAQDLIARFDRAGVQVALWDATSDIGLPVFACLALDDASVGAGSDPELGTGCHADREVAILRALTEAAQARTTFIAGSRDDFDPLAFDPAARRRRTAAARQWFAVPGRRDWREAPSFAGEDFAADLTATLGRLRERGLDRVVWVDLTRPDIGLPVVRVVVPGLEGPHQADCLPGIRARGRQ